MIADEYPWPSRTGYKLRLGSIVGILATQGSVDLLSVVSDEAVANHPADAEVPLRRRAVVTSEPRRTSPVRRIWQWLTGALPRDLLRRDWTAARTLLGEWSTTPYDLVWFSHARTYVALRDLIPGPRVVDLDNLQAAVLRHRRAARLRRRLPTRQRMRELAGVLADAWDERRWRRLEDQIAGAADAVVVCSELDRRRLGRPSVRVIANGYDLDRGDRHRAHRESRPIESTPGRQSSNVLIMVGLLSYGPNRDAADFFASEVLPRIRLAVPDAEFRLVGRHGGDATVEALARQPGIVVTGEVDDVRRELESAQVAVVPIRFGGGTRIKILEAFAHGVPVVTTTVGCEGLDVVDGQHLIIVDDPARFADACVRVLGDPDLRARLVTAGAELWARQYRWDRISPAVLDVVRAVRPA